MCEVKNCEDPGHLLYKGRKVCAKHWNKHCDETKRFDLKTCDWKRERKERS